MAVLGLVATQAFLWLWRAGLVSGRGVQAALLGGFSRCRAWAGGCVGFSVAFLIAGRGLEAAWASGVAARGLPGLRRLGSSQTRGRTSASRTDRWILYHWEAATGFF